MINGGFVPVWWAAAVSRGDDPAYFAALAEFYGWPLPHGLVWRPLLSCPLHVPSVRLGELVLMLSLSAAVVYLCRKSKTKTNERKYEVHR